MMTSNRIHKKMRFQKWRCFYVDLRIERRCNAIFTRKSNQQRHERKQHADDFAFNFDFKSNFLFENHFQSYISFNLERFIDDLLQSINNLDEISMNLKAEYFVSYQERETISQSISAWNHFQTT